MKKIAFIVAFVFAVLPTFSQEEKAVQAFPEGIYNKVADIRNNDNGDYETLVEKHCSRKFRLYYDEARRWEEKAGEQKSTGKTLLSLVYENGNWFIDDFTDYYDNNGLYKWSDSDEYKQGMPETVRSLDGYLDYLIENEQ